MTILFNCTIKNLFVKESLNLEDMILQGLEQFPPKSYIFSLNLENPYICHV